MGYNVKFAGSRKLKECSSEEEANFKFFRSKKMRRTWIKLFVDQILRGTLFSEMEDPAERFVWFGFLLLAGDSPFEGKIAVTDAVGYTNAQLASMLKCKVKTVEDAKAKMLRHSKIEVLPNNVIKIMNWKRYQSEYERKKVYRSRKRTPQSPPKSNNTK